MKKMALVAVMALGLGAFAQAAFSADTQSREASGESIQTERLDFELPRSVRGAIKKCPAGNITLQCLNKGINKLRKAFNNLVTAHTTLAGCLQKTGVTQYGDPNGAFGYQFDPDGTGGNPFFYTTSLDFTVPNTPTTAQMVVTVC